MRNRSWIVIAAAVVFLIAILIWSFLPKSEPPKDMLGGFEVDRVYNFVYTKKYDDPKNGASRGFELSDASQLGIPTNGPRGEQMIFLDKTMETNTFKVVKKTSPPVIVGSAQFQDSYIYHVVEFNCQFVGEQEVVPTMEPTNRRP